MKHTERITPVAAVLSAIATFACCLPLGVLGGAAVSVALAAAVERFRPTLLVLSVVLLAMATWQVYRTRRSCQRRSTTTVALLWLCAFIVIVVIVFPQAIASVLADWLS